jgi:GNAT superfamily N-acetyltransferase
LTALTLVTAAERPDLVDRMAEVGSEPWPEFLDHDACVNEHWPCLYELALDYQFALVEAGSAVAAMGNCIPFRWDRDSHALPDRGIDAVLEEGAACLREGATPTAVSALMIVVSSEWLGQGLSAKAIAAMTEVVRRHGLADLVAPVRPTLKHRYPLIPMERYIKWRRADGLPFDPWIRVHERVGGEIVGPASAAMRVTGTVAEWEQWTEMKLPESGAYVVPGALVPVEVDRDRDVGEYLEPACWMHHRARD